MILTDRETHFEFGANWQTYVKSVDRTNIDLAILGLNKLFPDGLAGKTFFDIGCGSGVHSLAALSLGAASVLAIDIDENSVRATKELLTKFAADGKWEVRTVSVFNADKKDFGTFDVVYSWGVLHHTGDMWSAIERAATFVRPEGQFAIAIYAKTALDGPWKLEKRVYKSLPAGAQWLLCKLFIGALMAAKAVRGKRPMSIYDDAAARGMKLDIDVHDWLGGWPYETATADELNSRISALGFREVRTFRIPESIGLFSSGCHELVFLKQPGH